MRCFESSILLAAILVAGFVSTTEATIAEWSVADGGNGHLYEAIAVPEVISWTDASEAANLAGGYLATITSEAENDFVFNLIDDDMYWNYQHSSSTIGPWLGGYQLPGSVEPSGGWTWVTGEFFDFTNWDGSGPDNQHGDQGYLHFGYTVPRNGKWNDLENDGRGLTQAYVVEYIPEPTTLVLLAMGGLCLRSRRRRK